MEKRKESVTVVVHDYDGLNCVIKSPNALEVIKSLLHSIKANYTLVDMRFSGTPRDMREHGADYLILVER